MRRELRPAAVAACLLIAGLAAQAKAASYKVINDSGRPVRVCVVAKVDNGDLNPVGSIFAGGEWEIAPGQSKVVVTASRINEVWLSFYVDGEPRFYNDMKKFTLTKDNVWQRGGKWWLHVPKDTDFVGSEQMNGEYIFPMSDNAFSNNYKGSVHQVLQAGWPHHMLQVFKANRSAQNSEFRFQ